MHEWYELSLPSGYAPVRVIDVKNKRTALLFNFAALGVMVLFGVLGVILLPLRGFWAAFDFFHYGIFLAALLLYIVLHELLHGLAYFLMTRQKLTFGLTLSAAFCGVPNIYVYRKTALIALLTPFAVFLPIFAAPVFLLQNPFDRFACLCLLAMHLGGCAGDLYDTLLLLLCHRDKTVLMRDTGPAQTIYQMQ